MTHSFSSCFLNSYSLIFSFSLKLFSLSLYFILNIKLLKIVFLSVKLCSDFRQTQVYVLTISRLQVTCKIAVACQAPQSMGFFKQEYWSELPVPSRGYFLAQGLNPCLLHLLHLHDSLPLSHLRSPQIGKYQCITVPLDNPVHLKLSQHS